MGVYFDERRKGWRFEFVLQKKRETSRIYKTKREAQQAETRRREELLNPKQVEETPTAIIFLELVNQRLDFIQAYKTTSYYDDNRYVLKRLIGVWGKLPANEITTQMIQQYILERAKESHYAANYDLRLIKALFNYGVRTKILKENPVKGIPFLPVEKRAKYVPPADDIEKVIALADPDTQDYLWTIRETMGRTSEINRLSWDDVDLAGACVILYTRKKKGGNLTPRKVPMTSKLEEILQRRYESRDPSKPWVFWQRYWCRKTQQWVEGPYQDRKKIMKTICKKAGVRYFRFHALRHAGASIMDNCNVPIVAIQEILGHENRSTTEIYLHSISGAAKQAMTVYEGARQKSRTNSRTNEKGATDGTQ